MNGDEIEVTHGVGEMVARKGEEKSRPEASPVGPELIPGEIEHEQASAQETEEEKEVIDLVKREYPEKPYGQESVERTQGVRKEAEPLRIK